MLTEEMIEHCAPTLAGIKTGNAFSVQCREDRIIEEIRQINRILTKKGLRLIPIRKTDEYTLIYLYRPARLQKDLSSPEAAGILKRKGYDCKNPDCCLAQLIRRLKYDKDFPHEIGLFLGYPPHDVKCFMKDPCRGVKCTGCWKVYGNKEEAVKTFERFKKCTEIYKKEAVKGKSLEKLIVSDQGTVL